MNVNGKHFRTVWFDKGKVKMINQPLLPHKFQIISLKNYRETAKAIREMTVRGAGAIGATAGFALAQAVLKAPEKNFRKLVSKAAKEIKSTRPTAQNLFYAVDRVHRVVSNSSSFSEAKKLAVLEAQAIADEDAVACKAIGLFGEKLIKNNSKILTHCNAGWLAFVDWGTALSPIYAAKRKGKKPFVFVDETRPKCQGACLTAWELSQERIPHKILADNASGHFLASGEVDLVIVGSDRIAANGDIANKIGTYEKAVLAKENGVPFFVAAPTSTIDLCCSSGEKIPIEERSEDEVLYISGLNERTGKIDRVRIAPKNSHALNPAFDVTPAKYISGIITEKGIVKANKSGIRKLF